MPRALRVLHAAADARDGAATAGAVESAAERLEISVETGTAAGLEAVRAGDVDCVVVEDDPPAVDGLDRLETFRDEGVPVVFVAADAERARAALDAGAADCVRRDAWDELAEPVAHRVATAVDGRGPAGDDESGTAEDDRELSRYRRIIQGVGDILYATDADGEYTHINPAGARVTGYSVDELLEHGPALVFDEAELETFETAIEGLLRDEDREVSRVEATIETKDGEAVPIEATLTLRYDGAGSFAGSLGVARDMTARKARERELREYETIVRALPDEVAILDTDGYITRYIPPAGAETGTSGFRPEELHGEHVSTVMTDESIERGAELIEELVTTDRQRGVFEIEVVGKDGETHVREDHLALIEDEDGDIKGTVGVLRDIEERKAYQRELERQNARLEAFAEIASHDLRNPLNVAHGYLEIARTDGDEEALERVDAALERMERLIDDTLTMARQGEAVSERAAVDVGALARESWKAVGAEGAELTVADEVTVHGDEDRLRQVVENLLRNAVEHGSTSPHSQAREDAVGHGGDGVAVRLGALEDGGFYVEDDGPGIAPEKREQIFDVGFSSDTNGTGFGLAIVAEIVEAHGWDVSVGESEAGGARFEVHTGEDGA